MTKHLTLLITFFLGTALLFSQQTDAQKDLIKRVTENYRIIFSDPEKAFLEAQNIEKEARKINTKEVELQAIRNQAVYYGKTKDFKEMLATAKSLYEKAGNYKIPVYQVMAKTHLFEAYIFSGLPDKAFEELEQGSRIMNRLNDKDSINILTKGHLATSYANYYSLKGDEQTRLKYTHLTGQEIKKIPNKEQREKLLFFHHTNIATIYAKLNQPDSARYYANLSLAKDKGYIRDDILSRNMQTLGEAELIEKNYEKAIFYFKKAEKLGSINHLTTEALYNLMVTSYEQLQQKDSVKIYQIKRDSLKLAVSENQKKSLTTLLNEKKESNPVYLYVLAGFLGIMVVITFFVVRKNRMLARQEKASREYLAKISENPNGEDYSKLLKALKEKDPAFMFYFEETFPDFSAKLLQINPKMSVSDIEFCALLKIKISTKDIARYKFIEPQSVRNKKNVIRKKLDIPKDLDIYQFINEI